MNTLTDSFLQALVTQLDNENTIGVAMGGSYARGEGESYSDVDIHHFVRRKPTIEAEKYSLRYIDGYLVSITLITLEEEYASLQDPKKAIMAIPGLRQEHILLDKDGSIAALIESSAKINWEGLQKAANAYASWNLSGFAEEALKILAGLAQRNESKTINAIWGLTRGLATTLLVQRGILLPTENAYIDLVQETAGRTSEWTRQFRLATGLDPCPPKQPPFIQYGKAGLLLYLETARLLQNILLPEDAVVVNRTTEIIVEAGY
jgi:predicted nucleotidyltransferase